MKNHIIKIDNIFAVQNEDGSFVGFANTHEIAARIKARADAATLYMATLTTEAAQ